MLGNALRKSLTITRLPAGQRMRLNDGPLTAAGIRVGPATAMRAATVYACTSLIAETIASLPLRIILRTDNERAPQRPPEGKALWDRPNAYQTTQAMIETAVLSLLLWGNGYLFPRRTNGGDIFELWPIDPDRIDQVEPLEDARGNLGARFHVFGWKDNDGWIENLPGRPVGLIHIPLLTLPGSIKGLSPIEQQAELIGMSLSSQEHAARFLGEGPDVSGTLELPGEVNETEAKEAWDKFGLRHAGPRKGGRVAVLTGGAKFTTVTIPPNQLQFLEQMQYTDRKLISVYRCPPHLVSDVDRSTSWGTGIEDQMIQWVQVGLLPIIRKVEEALEAAFFPGTDYDVRFNVNGLLRGDMAARAEFYRVLWSLGALTDNDILALEDMPPAKDGAGDIRYVPLNVAPADATPDQIQARAAVALASPTGGITPVLRPAAPAGSGEGR